MFLEYVIYQNRALAKWCFSGSFCANCVIRSQWLDVQDENAKSPDGSKINMSHYCLWLTPFGACASFCKLQNVGTSKEIVTHFSHSINICHILAYFHEKPNLAHQMWQIYGNAMFSCWKAWRNRRGQCIISLGWNTMHQAVRKPISWTPPLSFGNSQP